MTGTTGSSQRQVERHMDSNEGNLGSHEWIHSEIRRRAAAITKADPVGCSEDPYIAASREIFEELLTRFAGGRQTS